MATGQTTPTQIDPAVDVIYNRVLEERGTPYLVHELPLVKKNAKAKSGSTFRARRYHSLSPTVAPLLSGVNPTPEQLSKTDYDIEIQAYGKLTEITEDVELFNNEPVLAEDMELLGENWGESRDMIIRDILHSEATNLFYTNGSASTAVNTIINEAAVRAVKIALQKALAKPFRDLMKGSTRVGTSPLGASFLGICSPDVQKDLEDIDAFKPVQDYAEPGQRIHESEFGYIAGVRFLVSENAKIELGGGASGGSSVQETGSNADLHPVLIFGQWSGAVTDYAGKGKEIIVKSKDQIGGGLEMYGTAGWKMYMGAGITNPLWYGLLYTAVSD
jgi:N4-gp56 family major capsid protein